MGHKSFLQKSLVLSTIPLRCAFFIHRTTVIVILDAPFEKEDHIFEVPIKRFIFEGQNILMAIDTLLEFRS